MSSAILQMIPSLAQVDPPPPEQPSVTTLLIWAAIFAVIPNAVFLGFGIFVKSRVTDKRSPFPEIVPQSYTMAAGRDFKFDICSCFEDWNSCDSVCFCSACRLADIFHTTGVASYWEVLVAFAACSVAATLCQAVANLLQFAPIAAACSGLPGLILVIYLAVKRGSLRVRFGGESHFLSDCLCVWCCLLCSVCQMARQVDAAAGVEVVSLCTLRPAPQGPCVGQPVQAGMPPAQGVVPTQGEVPAQGGQPGVPPLQEPLMQPLPPQVSTIGTW